MVSIRLRLSTNYGADALRMTLMTGNAPGNDMHFYWGVVKARIMAVTLQTKEIYGDAFLFHDDEHRKSASNGCRSFRDLQMAGRWILSKVNTLAKDVTENMDKNV